MKNTSSVNGTKALLCAFQSSFLTVSYISVLAFILGITAIIPYSFGFIEIFNAFVVVFSFRSDTVRKTLRSSPFMPYRNRDIVNAAYLYSLTTFLLISLIGFFIDLILQHLLMHLWSETADSFITYFFLSVVSTFAVMNFFSVVLPIFLLSDPDKHTIIEFIAGAVTFSAVTYFHAKTFIDNAPPYFSAAVFILLSILLITASYLIVRKKYRNDIKRSNS